MVASTSLMPRKMSLRFLPHLACIIFILEIQFRISESNDPCPHNEGIDENIAEGILSDWPANVNLTSVKRSHKCYVTCILQYYNIVSSSGEIFLDKYYDTGVIDEFAVAPKINRCRYEFRMETDYCSRIFAIFNCLRQELLAN
ncbi:general odorant-binding protein 57d [Drosophila simulans]|uniref:Odorant-binding protein 57d n=2 Tax=Drosophila simulans TaxID=7240 RepID=A0A0J9RIF9_DROSI|nr:general odorant-binding protein 57d [Drosophila simulans]KMY95279.1 Odorant-binding protein 57d [Drosophila simulans]